MNAFVKAARKAGLRVIQLACTNPRCDEVTQLALAGPPIIEPLVKGPCGKCGGTLLRFKRSPREVEGIFIRWGLGGDA